MEIPLVCDPRYLSWESWIGFMAEGYAAQQLDFNVPEENWKQWGEGLLAIDVFTNEGIPSPYKYEKWQDWASALVGAVNQKV